MGLQNLKMVLAPPLWKMLSSSWRMSPLDVARVGSGPFIFACLHRDILPAIHFVRSSCPCLLVSNSPDGDILVRTLGEREYSFVRGSTGSGGGRALVKLRHCLEAGVSVGLAVDGPKGPYGLIQEGILHLARLTGVPVVPLRAAAGGAWRLGTWDRTLVPWPGARVRMVLGPRFTCQRDAEHELLVAIKGGLERFFAAEEEGA